MAVTPHCGLSAVADHMSIYFIRGVISVKPATSKYVKRTCSAAATKLTLNDTFLSQ